MNQKLKFLSFILFIALSGCQEDNIYQQNQTNRLTVKSITYSNAKEIKLLDNTLTKMFDGIKSHKSNNKSTTPVEDNDFIIDQTAEVKVMSDGNSTTYTMLIKREVGDPQYFENLVVKIDNESQPKAYIFKYIPSEESHYVWAHKEFSFKGSFEVHEIIYNSSVFQPLVNMSGCGKIALCDVGGATHNAGDNCTQVYYVLGNCDVNTPDSGGGSIMPYTAPVGHGGGAILQENVLKMNGFITTMSFPKQELFGLLGTSTQDAIFDYLVANNFLNGSTGKVSNFLQSMISNHSDSYILGDISATTINPNIEPNTNYIFSNLIKNNFSTQSISFSLWAFNYLSQNPNITATQFQNWFSLQGSSVGIESTDSHDNVFWNNSNLSFQQQALPTFSDFYSVFPDRSTTAQVLCTNIGGAILTLYNAVVAQNKDLNTCAIRLSYALNHSGVTIPNVPGTKFGADGKYYFTFAQDLNAWMRLTFGTNAATGVGPLNNDHHNFTKEQITVNPLALVGLYGIFSMTSTDSNWSTGHCDFIKYSDGTCAINCHLEGPIKYVDIWELH